MLCKFPTEIIEDVLLGLPILDLVQAVQLNRRLYEIAHNEKSPVKRRLETKGFYQLKLHIFGADPANDRHRHAEDCIAARGSEAITLEIQRMKIDENETLWTIWSNCTCYQTEPNNIIYPKDVTPTKILPVKSEDWRCAYKTIRYGSLQEAIEKFFPVLRELIGYVAVKSFDFVIQHDIKCWDLMAPLFDRYPLSLSYCSPMIGFIDLKDFNAVEVLKNRFFQGGIEHLYLHFLKFNDPPKDKAAIFEILPKCERVNFYGTADESFVLQDGDLLSMVQLKLSCIMIAINNAFSREGIANAIKILYDNQQVRKREIIIDGTEVGLKNVLSEFPDDVYRFEENGFIKAPDSSPPRNVERRFDIAYMTNRFGEPIVIKDDHEDGFSISVNAKGQESMDTS